MIKRAMRGALMACAVALAAAIGWSQPANAGTEPDTDGASGASVAQAGAVSEQTGQQSEPHSLAVNPVTGQVSASIDDYTPLTGDERWRLYFKSSFASWGAYFGPFFAALTLDQTRNDPPEWGGGFKGYGRRVASRVGTSIVQNTFQFSSAALLKEDVRYIASNQHGFKRRTGHALLYGVLTYNNSGHSTVNISNLGGYYAASATSTLWQPGRHNVALFALSDGSQSAGLGALVNVVQEFWPEIRRDVLRRH